MSERLIANELLAFLQQKLDVMDEVSATQICATNFSEEDVAAAKLLLYRSLNKCDQMVSRRRDGTKRSIEDIIRLLKETDPDDVPTFVARDLNKLPPVTFDHVDVTSLLKDIVLLKASLADVQKKLDASEVIVTDLRSELNELRKSVTVTRSPTGAMNVNMRRGACLDISGASFASAVLTSPLSSPRNAEQAKCSPSVPLLPATVPAATQSPDDIRHTGQLTSYAATVKSKGHPKDVTSVTSARIKKKPAIPEGVPTRAEDEGFVVVQKKKRRQRTNTNRCGKAPVEPNIPVRAAKPNTPVYISRLHYTTTAEDIVEYVRRKTKYVARVQLLESHRNVNFKAFVVRVPTCYLTLVMEENFWPEGVVFRRFRGQVPHERTVT